MEQKYYCYIKIVVGYERYKVLKYCRSCSFVEKSILELSKRLLRPLPALVTSKSPREHLEVTYRPMYASRVRASIPILGYLCGVGRYGMSPKRRFNPQVLHGVTSQKTAFF
jgi:hypothetical protein